MLEKTYFTKALILLGIVKKIEICAIQIESVTNQQIILCVYRSPSGNFHQLFRLFEIMVMSLYRPKTEFVICGDVNIDFLSDNKGHQNIMSMKKKFVSYQ
jgi:hypothetical protein